MAIGPEGRALAATTPTALNAELAAYLGGLEGIVDRALRSHRPGEVFLYGIHQEVESPVLEALAARYRAAGWSEARVRPGATGGFNLILVP